ncbi:SAYSvFN domain-containing protein 1-like [Paramacrobiotus metropolitanus]|uniref:SAYSvFN domain-containing protein 1-like n=1 Tax=Paramacrobiotus metropolitanus TaxID=2943436 RepID=UPI002445F379|nr:SAYSvFN domain-containing protein 1-like [Paramacrobiotus metropolitanus]XP_055328632.1 SAYSvFN domain-containing protein 1-like [Paramacrobiotus metropolitanus]
MDQSSGSRNTLKELEEFRKRKLAEREAVARTMIKSDSAPHQTDTRGSRTENYAHHTYDSERPSSETISPGSSDGGAPPSSVRKEHSSVFDRISSWLYSVIMPENLTAAPVVRERDDVASLSDSDDEESDAPSSSPVEAASWSTRIKLFCQSYRFWWILAWLCGFLLAVRFGWGAVYFALSVLVLIWKGLSDSRKRKRGTLSAYSVFNRNCERIEGTIDAEQLQRQMFLRF